MTYEEARQRAELLGYELQSHSSDHRWFNGIKMWGGQSIALQVWPEKEQFSLTAFEGAIKITTDTLGSFNNDAHFLKWQMQLMKVIEKL